jgi:hypothetical protein
VPRGAELKVALDWPLVRVEPTDHVRLRLRDPLSAAAHSTGVVTISFSNMDDDDDALQQERVAALRTFIRQQELREQQQQLGRMPGRLAKDPAAVADGATAAAIAVVSPTSLLPLAISTEAGEGGPAGLGTGMGAAALVPSTPTEAVISATTNDAAVGGLTTMTGGVAGDAAAAVAGASVASPPIAATGLSSFTAAAPVPAPLPSVPTVATELDAGLGMAAPAAVTDVTVPRLSEAELARLLVGRIGVRGCARLHEPPGTAVPSPEAADGSPPWLAVAGARLVPPLSGPLATPASAPPASERYEIHLGQRSVSTVPIVAEFTLTNLLAQPVAYRIRTLRDSDRVRGVPQRPSAA